MTDDEYETLHRLLDGEPENEPGGKIVEQVEAMVGRLRDENERLRGNAPMVDYDAFRRSNDRTRSSRVSCTRSEGSVPSLSTKRAAGGGSCPAFAALERHELAALGGGA